MSRWLPSITPAYKTLFTRDGLAVTRAQFDVRNSRRQFLRLSLPDESRIWSVFVNGGPRSRPMPLARVKEPAMS